VIIELIRQYGSSCLLMLVLALFLVSRLTNNILSTAQQVYLRQLGGAKPIVDKDGGGIISAGQAKRTPLPPPASTSATATATTTDTSAENARGARCVVFNAYPGFLLIWPDLAGQWQV
jgi:hypothetical protein